jgi:drug/metabolite transporter (DMT)-like permease
VWGAGDFCGGLATKRSNQVQVLAVSALSGIAILVLLSLLRHESIPSRTTVAWAAGAGLTGALGIASLYEGLAVGTAAVVAPTAAVMTAVVPVVFGALTMGVPRASQLAGFALAIVGIWLVSRGSGKSEMWGTGMRLGLLAGVGFGCFLILIAQVESQAVFAPLAVARVATLATAIGLMLSRGIPAPSLIANPPALLAGVLDAGGNIFYLFARQYVRLDIAAVLSSLYPVTTVMLARIVYNDPMTGPQWLGAGLCLLASALITVS